MTKSPTFILISASHSIQQAVDVPDLGGGHHHHVRDSRGLSCQLEYVWSTKLNLAQY